MTLDQEKKERREEEKEEEKGEEDYRFTIPWDSLLPAMLHRSVREHRSGFEQMSVKVLFCVSCSLCHSLAAC